MAPLLGDRFAGSARLVANLTLPVEALRRGIPTAAPAALLLDAGPPGWFRAWIAFEELAATEDLMAAFRSAAPPTPEEISAAMRVVGRMHDEGIEHPDLNLGNLLVRRGADSPEAWIIDLDGARLASGPLDLPTRLRGVRRLERSYLKGAFERGAAPDPGLRRIWYDSYESSVPGVAEKIHRAPGLGRARLWLHRLGWRR